jgi:hypothetical protein
MKTDFSRLNDVEMTAPITQAEFKAWVASRKDAGTSIDVETAVLKGWWLPTGAPYAEWAPTWVSDGELEGIERYFFVRGPNSEGWVWQGDLAEDKQAAMQARIDEHDRKTKEFHASREVAGRRIDTNSCEELWKWVDPLDPCGVKLVSRAHKQRCAFVRNNEGDDWIYVGDLPNEKCAELDELFEREWKNPLVEICDRWGKRGRREIENGTTKPARSRARRRTYHGHTLH